MGEFRLISRTGATPAPRAARKPSDGVTPEALASAPFGGKPDVAPVTNPLAGTRRGRLGPRLDSRSLFALARLGSLVTLLRWMAVVFGLALLPAYHQSSLAVFIVSGVIVVANTALRTWRPLRLSPATWRREAALALDLAVALTAVCLSGTWSSPFILTPIPTVILAAYGWGYREGLAAAALSAGIIALVDFLSGVSGATLRSSVLASMTVLLAALIGGFTRQLWLEAEQHRQDTLDQMQRMSVANDLLHALHGIVQTLPASLDLSDAVASTRRRIHELFDASAITLLVHDDAISHWTVELSEGVRLPTALTDAELPEALTRARFADGVVRIDDAAAGREGAGALPEARSVLAAALRARGRVVGIVSLEDPRPHHYRAHDAELLETLAGSIGLALDNAQWFGRLRTIGAEAERARIARDLHDRLAQSLAYVGFELDRLGSVPGADPEIRDLHTVVRGVVVELRETLYQLRATVDENEPLAAVTTRYAERFTKRTGVKVDFRDESRGHRLPVQVEQELWRILQEALTNVERHAQATEAWIVWTVTDGHASLEVSDNGQGIGIDGIDRDRFGLMGIRERADAIGARLTLDSQAGTGTRVLVDLEVHA